MKEDKVSGDVPMSPVPTSERVALLNAVSDCAPPEWGVTLEGDPPYLDWDTDRWLAMALLNDVDDAEAMVHLLDEMEKAGYLFSLIPQVEHPQLSTVTGYAMVSPPNWGRTVFGKTRAEAIARAFVSCFAATSQKDTGNPIAQEPTSLQSLESESAQQEERSK